LTATSAAGDATPRVVNGTNRSVSNLQTLDDQIRHEPGVFLVAAGSQGDRGPNKVATAPTVDRGRTVPTKSGTPQRAADIVFLFAVAAGAARTPVNAGSM